MLASVAAYDNALVSLTAGVASTYLNIRTLQQRIQVAQDNLQTQKESLRIARAQFEAGETSELDVQQAQTQLAQTQAQIPGLENSLRATKDSLAVLLGITPEAHRRAARRRRPTFPPPRRRWPPACPRTCCAAAPTCARPSSPRRRRARHRRRQGQSLSFVLAVGQLRVRGHQPAYGKIGDLFSWDNRATAAGASFVFPIFNYGRIVNSVRVQDAVFQQAVLNYQNTVLQAQQEVEDARSAFAAAQATLATLGDAAHSARRTTELAIVRYKEGASRLHHGAHPPSSCSCRSRMRSPARAAACRSPWSACFARSAAAGSCAKASNCCPQPTRAGDEAAHELGRTARQRRRTCRWSKKNQGVPVKAMRAKPRSAGAAAATHPVCARHGALRRRLRQKQPVPAAAGARGHREQAAAAAGDRLPAGDRLASPPSQTVDLVARVEGYLRSVNFTDGSLVKAGAAAVRDRAGALPGQARLATGAAAERAVRVRPTAAHDQGERHLAGERREVALAARPGRRRRARWRRSTSATRASPRPFAGRIGRHLVDPGNLVGSSGSPTKLATHRADGSGTTSTSASTSATCCGCAPLHSPAGQAHQRRRRRRSRCTSDCRPRTATRTRARSILPVPALIPAAARCSCAP